ncbi:MAG: carboxypeptidase M32 [Opitutaceae bacterium]|nr:carboxypeptidase M32 [Opitutaceae bacterium]
MNTTARPPLAAPTAPAAPAAASPTALHDALLAKLRRVHLLGTVSGLLGWDEQVNLPPDSADQRGDQMALLAELQHTAATEPETGRLLDALERQTDALDADQRVNIREARRDYDRATRLPARLVAEKARLTSAAYHAWADARENDNFPAFAPYLEKHLDLARREADALGLGPDENRDPYDHAIDKHDPGMTCDLTAALFAGLKTGLVPLVRRLDASPAARAAATIGTRLTDFDTDAQQTLLTEVTTAIGFNYRRGRIDVSLHPFCEGAGADIRMTTRFHADKPLDALFSAIHETGHGLYEQGLPLPLQGTPLGQAAGMAVHESQSRLWENQVARSRAFWRHFEPRYREHFPRQLAGVSSEELYRAINSVAPTLIRVESDEVHYNLHILLRFELERRLFSRQLAVRDLPEAWRALSQELLGLTPETDREGVLQDIHWSGGAFGYFPSYCLGNMIAAQLWATARTALPGLEDDFARGDFGNLLGWLRENIHAQGRRFTAPELVRHVTGADLSPAPLLTYLEERYGRLYP